MRMDYRVRQERAFPLWARFVLVGEDTGCYGQDIGAAVRVEHPCDGERATCDIAFALSVGLPVVAAAADGEPDGAAGRAAELPCPFGLHRAVERRYGTRRNVPLDVKAAHLEWVLLRYHMTPWDQLNPRVMLPVMVFHSSEKRQAALLARMDSAPRIESTSSPCRS